MVSLYSAIKNSLFVKITLLFVLNLAFVLSSVGQTLVSDETVYCEGSSGVTLSIEDAVIGDTYELWSNPETWGTWELEATITAVTSTQVFPDTWNANHYKLKNGNTEYNQIQITQVSIFNVTGGGIFCAGAIEGVVVGIDSSQISVDYELYRDDVYIETKQGVGYAFNFGTWYGFDVAGVYTVKAVTTECTVDMAGNATIAVSNPQVTFTFSESASPDCGTVEFTSTVTGAQSPYSYDWNFNDGTATADTADANPIHQFAAYGNATQDFTVSVDIVDAIGCAANFDDVVQVNERPHAMLEPPVLGWSNCNADPGATFLLEVKNVSTTTATNTNYNIDWGDGTIENFTPIQFPLDGTLQHEYLTKGTFDLALTIIGVNGCEGDTIYPVFNGSTPAGGLTFTPGILEGCAPHTITFFLSPAAADNPPTTEYYYDFGDGSDTTFYQENMPPTNAAGEFLIEHTYEQTSCDVEPNHSFTLTSLISNPCASVPNDIGGIKISRKAEGDFLRAEFPFEPIYVCVNQQKTFTSNTNEGCIIYGSNVISTTKYSWDFYNDGTIDFEDTENPDFTFPNSGTFEVRLIAHTGFGVPGNCGADEVVRTVCVQDEPVAAFNYSNNELCLDASGNAAFEVTSNNSVFVPADCAEPHYQWIVSPNDGTFTYEGGTNYTSPEPVLNFTQTGDYTIQLLAYVESGFDGICLYDYSAVIPITITGLPIVTVDPDAGYELCSGGTVNIAATDVTYDDNYGTITDYLWTVFPAVAAFNDTDPYPTIVFPDLTQTYTLTVDVTNECGTVTSSEFYVDVTETIYDNTISYPSSTNLCETNVLPDIIDGTIAPVLSGGDGGFTFKWFIDTGNGWTELVGETNATLNYTDPLTSGNTLFYREVTSGNCVDNSNEITFLVLPSIQNNTISSSQDICTGETPAVLAGELPTQGDGTYVYFWEQSSDNVNFIAAVGVNDLQNYTPPALTTTTYYRRDVTSDVCNSISNTIDVNVYEYPVITNANDSIYVCTDVTFYYNINTSIPQTTCDWVVSMNPDVTGTSAGSGEFISQTLVNTSAVPQIVYYTITPTGPAPTFCIGGTYELEVVVNPQIQSTYSDMSIPMNTSTTIAGIVSGGTGNPATFTYLWTPASMINGSVNIANPETVLLTSPQDYTVTVTDDESCVYTKTITVTPGGSGLSVNISANPASPICMGSTITLTANASGGGGSAPGDYTYTWTGLPAIPAPIFTNDWTVIIEPDALGTNTYLVEASDGFTTANDDIDIEVYEVPVINSANTLFTCSGIITNYQITSTVPNTTFSWTAVDNSGGDISGYTNGTGDLISDVLVNTASQQETVTYTITPVGPAPTFCVGNTFDLVVTVNPLIESTYADMAIPMNTYTAIAGVVSGGSGTPATYTYSWTPAIMIDGSTTIANPQTVLLTSPQDYTVTVTDNENCVYTKTITVTPGGSSLSVNITVAPDDIICIGSTITLTANASGGGGSAPGDYTYTWTGLPAIPAPIFTNDWTVIIEPDALGINSYSVEASDGFTTANDDIDITVNDIPVISSANTLFVCTNEAMSYQITSNVPGSSYSWTAVDNSGGDISGYSNSNGIEITDVLVNTGTQQETVTYTITPVGPAPSLCLGNTIDLVVTVNPQFVSTYADMIINMMTSTVIAGDITGGTSGYNYSWTPVDKIQTGEAGLPNPETIILGNPQDYALVVTDQEGCTYNEAVTITPQGDLLTVIISSSPDDTICDESSVILTATASGGNGVIPEDYTYNWTAVPGTLADGGNDWTKIYTPTSTGTNNVSVEVSDGFTFADNIISIVVNPKPIITSSNLMMICSGDSLKYTPVSDIPGTTFAWVSTNNSGGCVTGNTVSGTDSIANKLFNSCNYLETITYTIIPTGPAPTYCVGDDFTLTAAVNPVPHITNTVTDETILSGEYSSEVVFESDIVGLDVTYEWTGVASDPAITGWVASGTGDLVEMQISIPGSVPETGTITYTITPYVNNCAGDDFTYTINILTNPSAFDLSVDGLNEVCDDGTSCVSILLSGSQIGVTYQLLRDGIYVPGSDVAGTSGELTWCYSVAGIYTAMGTNDNTGTTADMTGSAEVIIQPLPIQYTLSYLQPGDNCLPITPHLVGSEASAVYELNYEDYNGYYYPAIQTLAGTGSALDFDVQTDPGTYSVVGTIDYGAISCTIDMYNSIVADSMPKEFGISPQGLICENSDRLCLLASEPGINYQLWLNNQPIGSVVAGDIAGGSICFDTLSSPGNYSIHAINVVSGCEMFFVEQITVIPQPLVFVPSPVVGCAGSNIILNGCEAGVAYYLYLDPPTREFIETAGPLYCETGVIDFGEQYDEGVYQILAIDTATNCSVWMDGTTTIYGNPEVFEISPQAGGCAPLEIYLEDFEIDAVYYLYRDNIWVATDDGTDGSVNFGEQTIPGNYTVKSKLVHPDHFECWIDMNGTVQIFDDATVFSLLPQDPTCPDVVFHLSGSELNVNYTLWHDLSGERDVVAGTGGIIFFESQSESGQYWVVASTADNNCETQMNGIRTVSESATIYSVTPSGQWCSNDIVEIGIEASDIGTTYQLHRDSYFPNPIIEIDGTGFPIVFGNYSTIGTYTVKAINNSTSCERWMDGEIIINKSPNIYSVTANGTSPFGLQCPPVEIGLNMSEADIEYTLALPDGTEVVLIGNGSPLVFGTYSLPGDYEVTALDLLSACTSTMNGLLQIFEQPIVYDFTSIDVPPVFCSGNLNAISLMLSYSQVNVSYQLNKDGAPVGAPIMGNDAVIIWNDVSQYGGGLYTVEANIVNDPFCSATMNGIIDVYEMALPTASISGGVSVCENSTCTNMVISITGEQLVEVTYTDTFSGQNITLELDPNTPTHSVEVCPTQNTEYQLVSVTYKDAPACDGVVDGTFTVVVNLLPEAFAGNSSTICVSEDVVFSDATASNNSTTIWTVTNGFGTLNDPLILNPTYSPSNLDAGNTVTFTLTAAGIGGCSVEEAVSVVDVTFESLPVAYAGVDTVICQGNTYTLIGAVSNQQSLLWETTGDGSFDDANIVDATYTPGVADIANGTVDLSLTAYAILPCTIDSTDVMTLLIEGSAVANAGADATICENDTYTMVGVAANEQSILWVSTGDGTFNDPALLDAVYTPGINDVSAGTVSISLTAFATLPCNSDATDIMELTINSLPIAYAGVDSLICENISFTLSGTVSNEQSVLWTTSGDGIFDDPNILNSIYTPGVNDNANGSVDLSLTAFAVLPCDIDSTDVMTLTIQGLASVDAGSDATICEDNTYDLLGSASNQQSVLWTTSGDGTFDNPTLLDAVYTPGYNDILNGSAQLSLTAYALLCETTDSMIITIQGLPIADAGVNDTVCVFNAFTTSGTAANEQTVFWTTDGDGNFDNPTLLAATYTPGANDIINGFANLSLTAFATLPCNTDSTDVMTLTIQGLPVADAGADTVVCENGSVTLLGSAINQESVIWTTLGDGSFDDPALLSATYTPGANDILVGSVNLSLLAEAISPCSTSSSDDLTLLIQDLPVANAGADAEICENDTYSVSGIASNEQFVEWTTSGDGSFDNSSVSLAVYTPGITDIANGAVSLSFTAYSILPCNNDSTDVMILTIQPKPIAYAGVDTVICETSIFNMVANSYNAQSVFWTTSGDGIFNNPTLINATYEPSINDINNGFVNLSLTAFAILPCAVDSTDVMTLSFQDIAIANAGNDTTICDGDNLYMQGSVTNAQSVLWTTTGDGLFDDASLLSAMYTPGINDITNGTVDLILTASATTPCGVDSVDVMTLTIDGLPTAYAGPDAEVCGNTDYTLNSATATDYQSVAWTTSGDGFFDNPTQLIPTYSPGANDEIVGQVSLVIEVTGNNFCSTVVSDTMILKLIPSPTANFTYAPIICDSLQFTNTSTSAPGYNIVESYWNFDDGSPTVIAYDTSHQFPHNSVPGGVVYNVSLLIVADSNGFICTDSIVLPVTVPPSPDIFFTFNPDPTCLGDTTQFYGESGFIIDTWNWDFGDGNTSLNQQSSNLYAATGNYTVTLDIIDNIGCENTLSKVVQVNPVPEASFTMSDSVTCHGNAITFVATGSATITEWYWEFGDGTFSYDQNPFHHYANAGLFTVTLTASDAQGCNTVVTDEVLILPGPTAAFSSASLTCTSMVFTDESVAPTNYTIVEWQWDFGDGSAIATVQNPSHSFPIGGIYDVTLIVRSDSSSNEFSCYDTITQSVSMPGLPSIYFTWNPEPTMLGETTSFYGTSGSTISTWLWDFGDGTTANTQNATNIFPTVGTFDVELTITDLNGCSNTLIQQITITNIPELDYHWDNSCQSEAIQFLIDSPPTDIPAVVSWSWDFGDGATSANMEPTHTYDIAGTYTVSLTIVDTMNATNTVIKTITVNPLPVSLFGVNPPTCLGSPVQFTDMSSSSVGYITEWHWDFGDGTTTTVNFPDDPDVTHVYPGTGPYTVKLIVVNTNSCTDSSTNVVTTIPSPVASFDHDNNCASGPVNFTDNSQENGGGIIIQWLWNFGDPTSGNDNTSTLQNPAHLFSAPGDYEVELIVINIVGCSDTTTSTVTVADEPTVDFTYTEPCLGAETQFTVDETVTNIGEVQTFAWDFGDGNTSNLQNPTHIYLATGTYEVTLAILTTDNCTASISHDVEINPLPTANFSHTGPACLDDEVFFTSLSSSPNGLLTTWHWDFGDGTEVTINAPDNPDVSHIYTNNTTFPVVLTVTDDQGCINSVEKLVEIVSSPIAEYVYEETCYNDPVYFTDISSLNSGTDIYSWEWFFGDPTSGINNNSTLQNPSHLFTEPGTYLTTLIIINTTGCSDTTEQEITVDPLPDVEFTMLDDSICFGESAEFTGISNSDISSWHWDFGDGGESIEQNPSYTYGAPGSYLVTLTVTEIGDDACQNSVSHNIYVNDAPEANFDYENTCLGDSTYFIDLSYSQTGFVVSWEWNFGDGNTSIEEDPVHYYENNDEYEVTLISTDNYGCSDTISKFIQVYAIPIPGFTFAQDCEPEGQVNFFDESEEGEDHSPIVEWSWNLYDGYYSTEIDPTYIYPQTDTCYTVVLEITDGNGCVATDTNEQVCLHGTIEVEFTSTQECLGVPTSFEASYSPPSDSVASYTWNFNDGSPLEETYHTTIDHTFPSAGIFIVELMALDTNGCTTTTYQEVIIDSLPTPQFSNTIGNCNAPTEFTDESLGGGEFIETWYWDFGDVTSGAANISTLENPTHQYGPFDSTYQVKLIVSNFNGCIDSVIQDVYVEPCLISDFELPTEPICARYEDICFTDISQLSSNNGTISQWRWDFGDGQTYNYGVKEDSVCHVYELGGIYDVQLIIESVINNITYSDTVIKQLTVHSTPLAGIDVINNCLGDSTMFYDITDDYNEPLTEWHWDFGDQTNPNDTSVLQNPTYLYPTYETYNVELKVMNQYSCRDSITVPVVIYKPPVAAFVTEETCMSYYTYFYSESVGDSSDIISHFWNFGDTLTQADTSILVEPKYIYDSIGNYNVLLTVTDGNQCFDTISEDIEIYPIPSSSFTVIDTVQQGQIYLDNTSIDATEYYWDFDYDNLVTSLEKNPTHQYEEDGNYNIMLVSYNEYGCPDTTYQDYDLLFTNLFVPNAFLPSSTNPELKTFLPTGINLKSYKIEVYSAWGNLVFESTRLQDGAPAQAWDGTYEGKLMPTGSYIWRISAIFRDDRVWKGSDNGDGNTNTSGTVTLIR